MIRQGRWVTANSEQFDCKRCSKTRQHRSLLMWSQEGSKFDGTCTTYDDNDYWTCYAHADGSNTCKSCPHYKGECDNYSNRGHLTMLPPKGYLFGRSIVLAENNPEEYKQREHKVFSQQELDENIYILPTENGNFYNAFKFVPNIQTVIDMYGIGRMDVKGYDKTIFPYIDSEDRCTALKSVQYEDNGHRSHFICQIKSFDGSQDEELDYRYTCLFGENIVKRSKTAKVCVVESEKTAVLAQAWAINMGLDLIFVATGGGECLKLNIGNLKRISETNEVYLFADNDSHWDAWKATAEENGWHFSDWRVKAEKDGIEVHEKDDFGDYVASYYWNN